MENISLFKVFMSENVSKPVTDVLSSGYITQGPKVAEFENKLQNYFGNKNVLTLNSATSGLTLAIRLLKNENSNICWPGFNTNDEVLTTALTCTATNFPIMANNLNIKWVDVDPETCNINLDDLKNKISEKTKIIMVVHWGGYPVDLDKLKEIQEYSFKKYNLSGVLYGIRQFSKLFRAAFSYSPEI